jgi:hypothetical protein
MDAFASSRIARVCFSALPITIGQYPVGQSYSSKMGINSFGTRVVSMERDRRMPDTARWHTD